MIEAAKICNAVASTGSIIDKVNILSANADNERLKKILGFIYNPYIRCGIGNSKLARAMSGTPAIAIEPEQIIDYLTDHQTGSDADVKMGAAFIKHVRETYQNDIVTALAIGIVKQDYKMGATVTTLNLAFGDTFIPRIGCMLGKPCGDVPRINWPCIMTEKLDGVRRILIKEKGKVKLYSKSGHVDNGLIDIAEEARYLPDNAVYDGELLAIGSFKNSIAQRQATISKAASKGLKTGLMYKVFDMIPLEEYRSGRSAQNALTRKITLGATMNDESISFLTPNHAELLVAFGTDYNFNFIQTVPILGLATCLADTEPVVNYIWQNNGEGIMLNTVSGYYEIKRTNDLIKIKHCEDVTLKIVDFIEGTGKFENTLGAVIVEYKGVRVGVGSGFDDMQRAHIWANRSTTLGKWIEIETFGESKNAAGGISLNCPIFKRFVGVSE